MSVKQGQFALVLASGFAFGIEFAILMPTVWQYVQSVGGSESSLGLVLASFSLTRTISFPLLGWWSDHRPMREPYVFCFLIGLVGNLCYAVAGGLNSLALMAIGRAIAGLGAACSTLNQTYVARGVPADKRMRFLSLMRGVSILGVTSGPALNLALVRLDDLDLCYGRFCVNSMTAAGYLMAIVNLVLGMVFLAYFTEPPLRAPGDSLIDALSGAGSMRNSPQLGASNMESSSINGTSGVNSPSINGVSALDPPSINAIGGAAGPPPADPSVDGSMWAAFKTVIFKRGGWFPLAANFMTGFEVTAIQTAITPIGQKEFGWGTLQNSYVFSAITTLAFLGIITVILLEKRRILGPRGIVVLSQIILGAGFTVGFLFCSGRRVNMYGIFVFGGLLVYGIILTVTPTVTVYTTMIGEYNRGVFMSYSQIVLGLARMCGPLVAGLCLEADTHMPLIATLAGIYILSGPVSLPLTWSKFHTNTAEHELVQHGGGAYEAEKGFYKQVPGGLEAPGRESKLDF